MRRAYAIIDEVLPSFDGVLVHVAQVDAHEALAYAIAGRPMNIRITHHSVRRAWCMGKCTDPLHILGDDHNCNPMNRARLFIREKDRRAA